MRSCYIYVRGLVEVGATRDRKDTGLVRQGQNTLGPVFADDDESDPSRCSRAVRIRVSGTTNMALMANASVAA
jgi:hypothetical protein